MPESPVTDRLVECMRDAGWDVERSLQGGVESGELPSEQLPAYQAASDDCSRSSGWIEANGRLDAEQIKELYRQEVEAHACFTAYGVDSAPPPSEQKYLDTFRTREQYYSFLPGFDSLGQGAMQNAVRACPPPTWFLNISGF